MLLQITFHLLVRTLRGSFESTVNLTYLDQSTQEIAAYRTL